MKTLLKALLIVGAITIALAVWNIHAAHSQQERLQHLKDQLDDIQVGLDQASSTLATLERLPIRNQAVVTMFTSRVEETDATPCIGAYGHDICKLKAQGFEVCASNDYPRGTNLTIDGLGTCIVLDRMASRFTGSGRVDWYAGRDLKLARAFGLQVRTIKISLP